MGNKNITEGSAVSLKTSLDEINEAIKKAISHSSISVRRGVKFVGTVVSTKMKKTATILIQYVVKIPKYRRYAKRRRKLHIHVPDGIQLRVGDIIEARPTRKISKTKSAILYKIIKRAPEGEQ